MMEKIKSFLSDREKVGELVRYVIAGGLTSLLALLLKNGGYMLLSADHTIEGANMQQMQVSNVFSWIVCVLFAFWINRWMVFRVKGEGRAKLMQEFWQFTGARVASLLLIELGVAALLKLMGVGNLLNTVIVLVLVTVFNYVASKFWIFKKPVDKGAPDESEPKQ